MTRDDQLVPDHLLPDEAATLGDPKPPDLGPDIDIDAVEDTTPPDCPLCGGPTIRDDRGDLHCTACDTHRPRTEEQEQRRQRRLREAHNRGSFMPISVTEWREGNRP